MISLFILLADNISGIKSLLISIWKERQDHPITHLRSHPPSPSSTSILPSNSQALLKLEKGPRYHSTQGVLLKAASQTRFVISPISPLNNVSALLEFLLHFYTFFSPKTFWEIMYSFQKQSITYTSLSRPEE